MIPSKQVFSGKVLRAFLLIIILSVIPGCSGKLNFLSYSDNGLCISTQWPGDQSDLQSDPALRYGRLSNGMAYVIMENHEPKDRVAMNLYIRSGSLNEDENQRGLGHFVEHMLFNGTTNYPPGTLVKRFQSMGMSFGADSNGYTAFDRTAYNILLAGNDRQNLLEGLQIMSDYARGALFLEEEVERERGVILAEKRARDTAEYRVFNESYKFAFDGTRAADRMVIGTEEVLTKADSKDLRRFYDQWYRPKNMVLVVVGDVSPDQLEQLVVEHFSGLQAAGPAPECIEFGNVAKKGEHFFYLHEPELGHTDISIESLWDESQSPDTKAGRIAKLPQEIAVSLMNNRFKRLVRESDRLFSRASIYSGEMFQRIGYVSVNGQTEGSRWQEALEKLHEALRQAREQGFYTSELERVKKEVLGDLEKAAQTAESRDSRHLSRKIIGGINNGKVLLSPEQELDFYRPLLQQLTLSEINEAFRILWKHDNTLVQATGTASIGNNVEDASMTLRRVYENSAKTKITPYAPTKTAKFPYLSVRDTGAPIVKQEDFDKIGVQKVSFADGTILNLKKTDFQENEVVLEVRFGDGVLGEPSFGLRDLAGGVINESGLGGLTREELDEALAGTNVNLKFSIGEDSFILQGKGLKNELSLLLQLVHAQLNDPGFRPEAYRLSIERYLQYYEKAEKSVEGIFELAGKQFLAGGNTRYGMASGEQVADFTLADVETWLRPVFKRAVPEINIVGDMDIKQVIALVSKYFGNSERNIPLGGKGDTVVFPSGELLRKKVASTIDKSFILVAWPTEDFWDISRTRRFHILDAILDDRLREEIREKMGATYSPVVFNRPSRVDHGYGVLHAYMLVEPSQASELMDKMTEVAGELAEDGAREKELTRALKPIRSSVRDMLRTNPYWLRSVLSMSSVYPQQLKWPLNIEEDFGSITVEDISALAARYLKSSSASRLIFEPEKR
ncbi:MAG: insulinase family protein [Desulfobulbaceae bacterium]|nr:insulinase family protein [Desulfobulbaceae bacterium]